MHPVALLLEFSKQELDSWEPSVLVIQHVDHPLAVPLSPVDEESI